MAELLAPLVCASGHRIYQLRDVTDLRYKCTPWREVTFSEFMAERGRVFTESRVLYAAPQSDDPADRAWRKWADDLRSAIGDREGWLTLTTHVRARGDSICFSGTTLV